MVTAEQVYRKLPKVNMRKVMTKANQSTNDIIQQVLSQHKDNLHQADKIAYLFDGGTAKDTCQNIWNFLKYQVPYKVEPATSQSTKTLSRIVYDAMNGGGNDCKHYAGFTGAILDSLGYKFKYRFAGYSQYISMPTHVYCVCNDGGNEILIDAVISGFDVEKPYKFKIDKKMSLYKLSGIDDIQEIGGVLDSIKSGAKKLGNNIKKVAQKVEQGVKTTTLAIPRNAFLLLLRFNVHGWATGLSKMDFNQLSWWKNTFGGNRTDLMNAIKAGAKEKRIFGFGEIDTMHPSSVGMMGEPVTITTSLASASPILIKVSDFLSKAEDLANKAEGLKNKIVNTPASIKKAVTDFKNNVGTDVSNIIFTKDAGQSGSKNSLTNSDLKSPTPSQAEKIAKAIISKPSMVISPILIGGGLLALLLILKKK
jgi:hypothetical protein